MDLIQTRISLLGSDASRKKYIEKTLNEGDSISVILNLIDEENIEVIIENKNYMISAKDLDKQILNERNTDEMDDDISSASGMYFTYIHVSGNVASFDISVSAVNKLLLKYNLKNRAGKEDKDSIKVFDIIKKK